MFRVENCEKPVDKLEVPFKERCPELLQAAMKIVDDVIETRQSKEIACDTHDEMTAIIEAVHTTNRYFFETHVYKMLATRILPNRKIIVFIKYPVTH
jgi:hypothetical protein